MMHPGSCGPCSECAGAAVEAGWGGARGVTQEQSPTGIVVFYELHTLSRIRKSGGAVGRLLISDGKGTLHEYLWDRETSFGTLWVVLRSAGDLRWIEIAPKWREWDEGQAP